MNCVSTVDNTLIVLGALGGGGRGKGEGGEVGGDEVEGGGKRGGLLYVHN